MKISPKYFFFLFLLCALACNDDDSGSDDEPEQLIDVVVLNEGLFMGGNASISTLDAETNAMTNNVFETANDFLLGDAAESIYFGENGLAYIVVGNSQKIEIVNAGNFASQGTMTDFVSPRYYQPAGNDFAIVSNLGNSTLDVLNRTNGERSTIEMDCMQDYDWDCGNEQVLSDEEYIYVASLADGSVRIYDTENFSFVSRVPVAFDELPKHIALDRNGVLWIFSRNVDFYNPSASVYKVELSDISAPAVSLVGVTALSYASVNMVVNEGGDQMYFFEGDGSIKRMGITDTWENRETVFEIPESVGLYGFGVDPNDEFLYIADAKGFTEAGEVLKIDIGTGQEVDRYGVGAVPSKFYFR